MFQNGGHRQAVMNIVISIRGLYKALGEFLHQMSDYQCTKRSSSKEFVA
jgi:hypothetical protein